VCTNLAGDKRTDFREKEKERDNTTQKWATIGKIVFCSASDFAYSDFILCSLFICQLSHAHTA